jgi:site-specific DNA-methyltransferase (adenine-specific)
VTWSILEGDCIDVMRTLPSESVDAVITSPPYAMQRKATYGGVPESEYPAWTVAWMTEARRLLKPDGSVIINIAPHVRGGVLSDYVLRTRLALRDNGWAELDELVWHKTNAMPTGSPRRPRRSWESLLWYGMHGRAWSDAKAGGAPVLHPDIPMGPSRSDRIGWGHGRSGSRRTPEIARVSTVVSMGKASKAGPDHPAPYPPALAEWAGKLVCPPGGTILDPFSGSASTGVACIRNGWDYIGIEAMPEYAEMSRRRLEQTAA